MTNFVVTKSMINSKFQNHDYKVLNIEKIASGCHCWELLLFWCQVFSTLNQAGLVSEDSLVSNQLQVFNISCENNECHSNQQHHPIAINNSCWPFLLLLFLFFLVSLFLITLGISFFLFFLFLVVVDYHTGHFWSPRSLVFLFVFLYSLWYVIIQDHYEVYKCDLWGRLVAFRFKRCMPVVESM